MPENYIKAEIVQPHWEPEKCFAKIFAAFFGVAFRTLIVWWFFAASLIILVRSNTSMKR